MHILIVFTKGIIQIEFTILPISLSIANIIKDN